MATQQETKAAAFVSEWQGHGNERSETQKFWLQLLGDVLGKDNISECIVFEKPVTLTGGAADMLSTGYIDAYIKDTRVLIEQKSLDVDLGVRAQQSGGIKLTPYQQAKRYADALPYSEKPRWIVTCNFGEMRIYDMDRPTAAPQRLLLCNLPQEVYRLRFLVDAGDSHIDKELEVSIQAGEIVGLLYDELIKQYREPESPETLRSLNILCVRLVFCLYAEDAGIFGTKTMFHDYLAEFTTQHTRRALSDLFRILDTKPEERDPYLASDNPRLAAFPYVNGGLFSDTGIEIPPFTDHLRTLLLQRASADFDWSTISPTIFGAVFESTLNPETRRTGGMHYTGIENIHKVIDPLFLDDLRRELNGAKLVAVTKTRRERLIALQSRMAALCFLDPACGSGNFLTETYLSLRRIENDILRELYSNDRQIGFAGESGSVVKVNISRFFGIEINDFAVTVAKTALWIAESQMLHETENIVGTTIDFLPLHTNAGIVEGNALRTDWATLKGTSDVLGGPLFITTCSDENTHHYDYIIGNPPFSGARIMSKAQKDDLLAVFGKEWKNIGNLDYVTGWYKKAADLIQGTQTRCAFVSTNSVTQGEQVAALWKPLFAEGLHFDFAYRTFRWDSESTKKAHVHCVIIGFSCAPNEKPKVIYDGDKATEAQNINGYLMDAKDVFIYNRSTPLCTDAPKARSGNKPIDGGNYLFSEGEMNEFLKVEPKAKQYFHPWYGAEEFIHRKPRYCLWLGECTPAQLRAMPHALKRVDAVRKFRLESKSEGTQKLADNPTHFHVETIPHSPFLVLPLTSSERRRYVPIGFMQPECLASNLLIVVADATLYDFGVLTSSVFMAWMRTVCGRLKSDYRITKDNVYNNFVWPEASEEQQAKIEQTAQAILDARAAFPDSSLADLYDELTMPEELRRAHRANDLAVLKLYGFPGDAGEGDIVSRLMELYRDKVKPCR